MNKALSGFQSDEVTFLYKYVDDLIAAVDKKCMRSLQNEIESLLGMKMKTVGENEDNEVDYLQMKVSRNVKNGSLNGSRKNIAQSVFSILTRFIRVE